jgi:ribonuclease J
MGIEFCAIGGYQEIGRHSCAIKVDDEVVILDLGLHMENYVKYTEDEDIEDITAKQLTLAHAVPDLSHISDWKEKIKAIIPSHAHLDHIGAIPFLGAELQVPIIATPFTIEVINATAQGQHIKLKNKFIRLNSNSSLKISSKITVELIHVTHSTPQTAIIAIHTPYGTVLYANDFKLDNSPVLGGKPNYARLKQLRGKVVLLITNCLYAEHRKRTPSEAVARQLLKETMLETDSKGKAMIVTTFSSHIARLKSIIDFGKKMNRRVVFMGRSLNKYVLAAEKTNIVRFTPDIGTILYGERARRELKRVGAQKGKYLLVMTGHQGEPNAMLSRIANDEYKFGFDTGDFVVFSCTTIPTPITQANRKILETKLNDKGIRMFFDIHASGHAAREDLREFIGMLQPKHIIPTHGAPHMLTALADLASHEGYSPDQIHLVSNGQRLKID